MYIIKKSIKYIFGRFLKFSIIPILGYVWKLNAQKDIFIICEHWDEARDNGFALFKYLRKKYPEKPIYYIFNTTKKNIDFQKLQTLGNILSYKSIKTFVYLYYSKYIASPHADIMYLYNDCFGDWDKKTTCFLQHGVIINDLGSYYREIIAKFDMICSGSVIEYDFLKEMSEGLKVTPIYTGLSRWDRLHKMDKPQKMVLVMPTWRRHLVLPIDGADSNIENRIIHLKSTQYYKKWQEFLDDTKLHELLEKNDIQICFFAHHELYKAFGNAVFSSNSPYINVADKQEIDISQVIENSAMLITDFSSIFWEFAYMKRPIIYYQFDTEEFRLRHWSKGYFDYKEDGFGAVVEDLDSLLGEFQKCIHNQFSLDDTYNKKTEQHFILYDDKNCERIYQSIINFSIKESHNDNQ